MEFVRFRKLAQEIHHHHPFAWLTEEHEEHEEKHASNGQI